MEFPFKYCTSMRETLDNVPSDIPIRLFTPSIIAQEDSTSSSSVSAVWEKCSPGNIKAFSAVAFYFGLKLYQELKVPIGLIDTALGGSRIEPWLPPSAYAGDPALKRQLSKLPKLAKRKKKNRKQLSCLFDGIISPIIPYAIRGVIWYQGEANVRDVPVSGYLLRMKLLVNNWRKLWNQGNFPFFFVQIAPFQKYPPETLPQFWQIQYDIPKAIDNCNFVSTIDVGNVANIHPKKKREVGERLGKLALVECYGKKNIECYSPSFFKIEAVGRNVKISFKDTGKGGLITRDGKAPSCFEVAGSDEVYYPAEARIDGHDMLMVSCSKVNDPVWVKFAWHNVAQPNLASGNGLPALPFGPRKVSAARLHE